MAYGTPANPVGGTVITVAYAVANILDPIRWLRLLTGNADPPGSSYVVVSTSTTGTSWQKVPADALAAGVAVANLGYTPINKAGDTGIGSLTSTGIITAVGLVAGASGISTTGSALVNGNATVGATLSAGSYAGGSTAAGVPSVLGLSVGASGVATTGPVNPASYLGGSTSAGVPSFKGVSVGTDGVASAGPIITSGAAGITAGGAMSAASYAGGSTSTGVPSFKGVSVGADGVASAGPLAGSSLIVNGIGASATPAAGRIPMADGSGTLDAWISVSGGAVPSGLGGWVRKASEIPAGFSRETSLDGLIPVGAGTTFSQTFTEEQSYGSSWQHLHNVPSQSVSVTSVTVSGSAVGGPEDVTGAPTDVNGLATAGGVNLPTATHGHSLNGVSFAVSASGTGSGATAGGNSQNTTWLPPSRAVVWVRKN